MGLSFAFSTASGYLVKRQAAVSLSSQHFLWSACNLLLALVEIKKTIVVTIIGVNNCYGGHSPHKFISFLLVEASVCLNSTLPNARSQTISYK